MTELQTLEGLDDAHRGAGFSCQLGNAEQGHATGVLSNLSSVSLLLHRGWPQLQQVHDGVLDLVYRGPLPNTCPCTAQHNLRGLQKMARAIFSQVTVLAAFSGGSVSRAPNQQTP